MKNMTYLAIMMAAPISGGAVLLACSDSTTDPNDVARQPTPSPSNNPPSTSPSPPASSTDAAVPPLYFVSTTLNAGTDQATSLVFTAPSISDGPMLDESKGIEIPGAALPFGRNGTGSVVVMTNNTPIATRYTADAAGALSKGPELSFQSFGVGQANSIRSVVFVSDTKAYLLDDTTLQAIVWNPSTMTTDGTKIDLSAMGTGTAGVSTYFSYEPRIRGNQIIFGATYYDADFNTVSGAVAAIVDTTTDKAVVVKDPRCSGLVTTAQTPSGDIYFGTDPYYGAIQRKNAAHEGGCILRMKSGENAFDASFLVKVKDVTGKPGGGAILGENGTLLVRAFDESLFPVTDTTTQFDILGAAAWQFWKVDPANPTATAVRTSIPAGAGDLKSFTIDGKAVIPNCDQGYKNSTLYGTTTAGGPTKLVGMKGYTAGVIRIR